MKKKKLNSLRLNKQKISQLHDQKGGNEAFTTDQITMSTCTCISCLPNCQEPSVFICPPPITRFCTVDCQTLECTFGIVCPIPIDVKL